MTFKKLTIAAAIVAMTSLGAVAPVFAQPAAPAAAPADQAAAPAAAPADQAAAPAAAPADQAAAPAGDAAKSASAAVNAADQSTPYGLKHMVENGDWISRTILAVLVVMSAGTWYIFFTKWIEQQRIIGQANQVEKKFWTSATLNEGVDRLPRTRCSAASPKPASRPPPAAPLWSASMTGSA